MKKLGYDEVYQILNLMKNSNFVQIRLEFGNLKIDLKKSASSVPVAVSPPLSAEGPKGLNLVSVTAPMLGLFFRSSKPGESPPAEPGQEVREDDVLGTIEVLQQRHPVKSPMRGRIKQVCARDGQMVEFKQPLFLLEP
jgi:acetyl-CoA carboxylase biotin carboxyl carrier protein